MSQNRPPGAKAKLRAFLLQNVGEVLGSDTLRGVAGTSEWGRRIRELRDEQGMDIVTHNDVADMRPGQYMLRSLDLREVNVRGISKETRAYVLDRDGYTCQSCGAAAGESSPFDVSKTVRLQLGHILDKSHGGTDEVANLRVLCSVCNEGVANLSLARPTSVQLLSQVRRAPQIDQRAVLRWLKTKFPDD